MPPPVSDCFLLYTDAVPPIGLIVGKSFPDICTQIYAGLIVAFADIYGFRLHSDNMLIFCSFRTGFFLYCNPRHNSADIFCKNQRSVLIFFFYYRRRSVSAQQNCIRFFTVIIDNFSLIRRYIQCTFLSYNSVSCRRFYFYSHYRCRLFFIYSILIIHFPDFAVPSRLTTFISFK